MKKRKDEIQEFSSFQELKNFCLYHCPHPKKPCGYQPCKEYKEFSKQIRGKKK